MNASRLEEGQLKPLTFDEQKKAMENGTTVLIVERLWGDKRNPPKFTIGKINKVENDANTISYEITVNGKLMYGHRDSLDSFAVYALPGSSGGSRKRKGSRRVTRRGTRRTKLL